MKKLLAFLVIVGVGGFLVYRFVITSASERSCQRLASLCGKTTGYEQCVSGLAELGKTNAQTVSTFESCVSRAKTCSEGAGCLVGAGVGAATGVLNDFIKGVGSALGK
jgi:hypothetical protein